ncbi:MAG: hypothetical protein OSB30_01565 [Candidatus Poseidoniaceae archaeon]|nr:hypothetical protein [Candidatus Poseidoniaceae archaeon]
MTMPKFPCIAWRSDKPVTSKHLIGKFLENRFDERWMLVAQHAVQFEQQLWTAWNCCERNFANGNQLARGRDAEFLRYIAGTHHVSEAFSRAGIQDGVTAGWILYLPKPILKQEGVAGLQPSGCDEIISSQFESDCHKLLSNLGLQYADEIPTFSPEAAKKLGLVTEGIAQENLQQGLVGHILSADFSA